MHDATGVRTGHSVSEGSLATHTSRKVRDDAGPKGEKYFTGGAFAALLAKLEQHAEVSDLHARLSIGGEEAKTRSSTTPFGIGGSMPPIANLLDESLFGSERVGEALFPHLSRKLLSDEDMHNLLVWYLEGFFMPQQKGGAQESTAIPSIHELRQTAFQLLNSGADLDPTLRASLQRFLNREMNALELLETASILVQVWQLAGDGGPSHGIPANPTQHGIAVNQTSVGSLLKLSAGRRGETRTIARLTSEAAQNNVSGHESVEESMAESSVEQALADAEILEEALEDAEAASELAEANGEANTVQRLPEQFGRENAVNGAQSVVNERTVFGDDGRLAAASGSFADNLGSPSSATVAGGATRSFFDRQLTDEGFHPEAVGRANEEQATDVTRVRREAAHVSSLGTVGTTRMAFAERSVPGAPTTVRSLTTVTSQDKATFDTIPFFNHGYDPHTWSRPLRDAAGLLGERLISSALGRIEPEVSVDLSTGLGENASSSRLQFNHLDVQAEMASRYPVHSARTSVARQQDPQILLSLAGTEIYSLMPSSAGGNHAQINAALKTVSQSVDVKEGAEGDLATVEEEAVVSQERIRDASQLMEWASENKATRLAYAADHVDGRMSGEGGPTQQESADVPLWSHVGDRANKVQQTKTPSPPPQQGTVPPDPQRLSRIIQSAVIEQSHERHTIQLQLEPEALGRLQLRVAMENGAVTAHFVAETEAARRMIEAGMQQLKENLYNQGVDIQEVEVSLGHEGGFDDHRYDQANTETVERFPAAAQRNKRSTAVKTVPQVISNNSGGVDVLI